MLDAYIAETETAGLIPLRWFGEPKPGKSNALNSAIPRMAGDYTVFIDDDHRVDSGFLTAISRAIEAYPEADLFCGKILPDWDGSEPEWVHEQGEYRIYPLPVPRFDLGPRPQKIDRDIAVPGGGNLIVKTALFAEVGGFSTDLGPVGHNLGGAEDFDWVMRAYGMNKTVWYCPDIVQYHYVDRERLRLSYLMKKAYERSSSTVRLSEAALARRWLVPRYLVRKLLTYFFHAALTPNRNRRRFYLVRLAAAAGEIKGFVVAAWHRQ